MRIRYLSYIPNLSVQPDNKVLLRFVVLIRAIRLENLDFDRAWYLGEEKDKEVQKFPLNRGDNKPCRCEQRF